MAKLLTPSEPHVAKERITKTEAKISCAGSIILEEVQETFPFKIEE